MKKRKKSFKIGCLAMVAVLIGGILVFHLSVWGADALLPGVERIVADKSTGAEDFRILEIVPDGAKGEIGYYVKGQEPYYLTDRFEDAITNMASNTQANRLQYVQDIKTKMQSLITENATEKNNYPLFFETYQENYFPAENEIASWKKINFPDGKYETVNMKGHYEACTAGEKGDYTKVNAVYEPVARGTGDYLEQIDSFTYMPESESAYYEVTFLTEQQAIDLGTPISNENRALGSYLPVDPGDLTKGFVMIEEPQTGITYYYVSDYAFSIDGTSNPAGTDYYAVLKSEEPYKQAAGGNYKKSSVESYQYTPETGDYKFVQNESDPETEVICGAVYYKGGFTNNNWFKKHVFAMEETEYDNFNINVTTVTPAELAAYSANQLAVYDLVYICGNTPENSTVTYGKGASDITWSQAYTIFSFLAGEKLPCIIDYSSISGASETEIKNSYMCKLMILAMQDDIADFFDLEFHSTTEEPTSARWSELIQGIQTGSANNFAKDNIYSIANQELVALDFTKPFEESVVQAGFAPVLELIKSENTLRDKSNQLPTDISKCTAVQYILNHRNARQIVKKSILRILEVQPTTATDLTDKITQWTKSLNMDGVEIKIDSMSSAEFIGKINDLNTDYDMIYFGLNTKWMNTNAAGQTVYNDTSMNGLIYTHTGDRVICEPTIAGMLNRDYVGSSRNNYLYASQRGGTYLFGKNLTVNNFYNHKTNKYQNVKLNDVGVYRYSGNDINQEKMNEVLDYVKAKYAVVLANDFYTYNKSGDRTGVNTQKIDNSSYMYELVNETFTSGAENVISEKEIINSSVFSYYVNMPKLTLSFQTDPGVTIQNGRYYLKYEFMIDSSVELNHDTNYFANLYLDANADGKYATGEKQTDFYIINASGAQPSKDNEGRYQLKSKQVYTMFKEMPSSYVGTIPWKIEISQVDNNYIRTSKTDYSVISKSVDEEKETIKILQIKQSSTCTGWQANNFDLSTNTAFQNLLTQLNDFKLDITTIPSDKFVQAYNQKAQQGIDYLDDYNMLILGFADVYAEIDNTNKSSGGLNKGPVDGILSFIESGRSVLFTHDTASFINTKSDLFYADSGEKNASVANLKSWVAYWGYNINTIIRDVVGMDRYGISSNNVLKEGDMLTSSQYAAAGLLDSGNDLAYVAGSNRSKTYPETQGYCDHLLNGKRISALNTYMNLNSSSNIGAAGSGNGAYNNINVTKVNDGQITSYPFKIPDKFIVSTTHYQYYQLDLESDADKDGKGDIVVWYCLSDVVDGSGKKTNNPYTVTENDVRNNYYIYSKGNVMYSGVGHSTVNKEDEMKLFINTMIASYKSSAKNPNVTVLESGDITSAAKKYEYLTFDESMAVENEEVSLDKDIDIYFTVSDSNIISTQKTISVDYYVGDENGSESIVEGSVKATKLDLKTYNSDGSQEVANNGLTSNGVYKITVPNAAQYLKGKDEVNLYIETTSSFNYYGKQKNMKGYGVLSLVKTQLFELD
ncbi:DUF5057 domain-containing protein [Anaerosacchariphilus polymeriproducens]|uniref:DUF5057 domain-containing protein n=1 Tax=Anaerosacchariphilus polymeriproducens TaxID=1812858 RepID=A0A371AQN6_9FIRM|nr:DUF5057 domain-containing protein [Anaerosacchariphilus polymeriproducens]RDU21842.1 DUF5057 domain-containing protein [Anaerosacchariphilus polymeriproducens]